MRQGMLPAYPTWYAAENGMLQGCNGGIPPPLPLPFFPDSFSTHACTLDEL